MRARIILVIVVIALFIWGMFTAAGRWDWMQGWGYLALIIGGGSVTDIILWFKDPELLRRRSRFGAGTKTWDKVILTIFGTSTVMMMCRTHDMI